MAPLQKKNNRLVTVPDEIIKIISTAQAGFFDSIIEILSKLEQRGGIIVASEANFNLLNSLFLQLDEVLSQNPKYAEALIKYSNEIATQAKINDDYFRTLVEGFKRPALATSIIASSRLRAMELLLGNPAEAQLIFPIKDLLLNSVTTGASFKDTVTVVREFVLGTPEKEGKLLRYSKQIVYDNFAITDASYTTAVSNEFDFEWFVYQGNLIDTSRPFCIEMVGVGYFHRKEIEQLGEGINITGEALTEELEKGRHEGTNAETIFVYRGGYNCQHNWMPVSVFDVPDEVIERNVQKGFYVQGL